MSERRIVLGPDVNGRTVVLAGEHIAEVHPRSSEDAQTSAASEPVDDRELSTGDGLHIPCDNATIELGAVNAHTHVYSGLAPLGMPPPMSEPESFPQILERVWWCLDRALDETTLRASARYYMAQALLSGTTTLIDHHESPDYIDGSLDVLAETAADLGIRVVLGYGATERNGGEAEARAGLAECDRLVRSGLPSTIRGVVALHASFTVSDETVRAAGKLCRDLGVVLHTHLAEASDDVADAVTRGYPGPWERLVRLEAVPTGSILAHGVHLCAASVDDISARGCWLVQNPRSNEGNRVGYPASIARTPRVALGTDGYPADMREEITHLERLLAARGEDSTARLRVEASRTLVAEVFGEQFELRPGAVADLVVRDDHGVHEVFVAGRQVVHNGRLVAGDLDEIESGAATEATRLWSRMRSFQSNAGQ